ncbi:MAG TPA: c-type cytochrome [Kofleriaceae bacterium]
MTPGRCAPAVLAALAAAALAGCGDEGTTARELAGGDPGRAKQAIRRYGCGTCHEIPGLGFATSHVGPSLDGIGARLYLAGRLPNTPDHLIDWIRHPQAVEPGNVMPDMGVTEADARDIAALLYRLR